MRGANRFRESLAAFVRRRQGPQSAQGRERAPLSPQFAYPGNIGALTAGVSCTNRRRKSAAGRRALVGTSPVPTPSGGWGSDRDRSQLGMPARLSLQQTSESNSEPPSWRGEPWRASTPTMRSSGRRSRRRRHGEAFSATVASWLLIPRPVQAPHHPAVRPAITTTITAPSRDRAPSVVL